MIQCCPLGSNHHPQCYPIHVAKEDPFYSKYEETCMNFVRTAKCPQCKLGTGNIKHCKVFFINF